MKRLPFSLPLLSLSSLFPHLCPAPSPRRRRSLFPSPAEQSLAAGWRGAVRLHRPVVVVAPAPSPRRPCPRCSPFPPHEQLLAAAAVKGDVAVVAILLVVSWPLGLSRGGVLGRPCLR